MYMRHKYVNMDVNSAFLKLTNGMACVKIILNVKQKSLLTRIPQLSTIFVLLAVFFHSITSAIVCTLSWAANVSKMFGGSISRQT